MEADPSHYARRILLAVTGLKPQFDTEIILGGGAGWTPEVVNAEDIAKWRDLSQEHDSSCNH